MLWNIFGQVVDDAQEGVHIPEGAIPIASYENPWQYTSDQGNRFQWEDWMPRTGEAPAGFNIAPGYVTQLLAWADAADAGTLKDYEQAQWEDLKQRAMSVPLRQGTDLHSGWTPRDDDPNAARLLNVMSPDIGHYMLTVRDKLKRGTASAQERQLFQDTVRQAADWNYRATVPQASDANPFGLGDNLMGALMMLSIGAGGAAAAAPLAAGAGLTLSSAGGLLASASGITSMLAEPLDSDALKLAGLAMGAAGGVTSLASLLSNGLNSVGDVVKAVQKVYGTGTKAMALVNAAQQAGANPAMLAQAQQQGRTVGSTSQALSTGSSGGGSMAGILDQLGPLLAGAVGAVGTGLSLADVNRYMEQLKTKYGQQEDTKRLIDEAYQLAKARYETMFAQSQEERQQKQAAYQDQLQKYQTHYGQTQTQYAQQQGAYTKGEAQLDQDRQTQIENYQHNRQKVDESYNRQVQEAAQERDFQLSQYGADRGLVLESYNRRVAEAQQDRQKEVAVFDQQFAKYQQDYDRRVAEAAQERGLDLTAYQQRQAIGRNLSDPAALKAGAEALYQPLSALARDRVNTQTEEEMARRGVAGGGMISNYMAAKAFAPQEQQLWSNALQAYLSGQTGALNAYTQQDMTMSPEYRFQQVPNFTNSPEYRQMQVPNLVGSPSYSPYNTPTFSRASAANVPAPPGVPGNYPGAPGADWNALRFEPGVPTTGYPEPYEPWGTSPKSGGGALAGAGSLVEKLVQVLKGATGGGGNDGSDWGAPASQWAQRALQAIMQLAPGQQSAIQAELDRAMQQNPDLFGFGGGAGQVNPDFYSAPVGPGLGWDSGIDMYAGGSALFDESMGSLPYDNWSYNPDWGFEATW